jgi:pimeloyl-ACP methyl ester carboxylesterase
MSARREITFEIPGLKLAARVWGTQDKAPIICLHGWMDNAATFDLLAPLLVNHQLICIDLPGHGRSDHRPPGNPYHYVDWICDVVAAADALELGTFSLMGHSMGAGISAMLAGALPERVQSAVLIEGLGPLTTEPSGAVDNLHSVLSAPRRPGGVARIYPDRAALCERKQNAYFPLTEEAAAALVKRGSRKVPGGLVFSHDPRLRRRSRLRFTEAHVQAFLEQITCPTLVVWGREGLPFGDHEERRINLIRRSTLQIYEGSHHLHLENAATIAGPIDAFFDRAHGLAPQSIPGVHET